MVSAVIVAAGSGTRMGKPKQLLEILGIPVIARTMLCMQKADLIDEIVVVARPADAEEINRLANVYGVTKLSKVLPGGTTRLESVGIGTQAAKGSYYCIHDGARPLVKSELVNTVIEKAMATGAAALGTAVTDTIKQVGSSGEIVKTVDRSALVAIETPQVFKASLYDGALKAAVENGIEATDDCFLFETAGYPVFVVEGGKDNIKITLPEDIPVAESILRNRG